MFDELDYSSLTDSERDREIQEGLEIDKLTQTEGWKILEKAIDQRIDYFKYVLISETDLNKVYRWQEAIKWGLAIKNFVQSKVDNARVLLNQKTREEDDF